MEGMNRGLVEALSRCLPGATEESHKLKSPSGQSVSRRGVKPSTSRIIVRA
jgi:hypothetical protein